MEFFKNYWTSQNVKYELKIDGIVNAKTFILWVLHGVTKPNLKSVALREGSQIDFFMQASGCLGVGVFAGGCFKKSVKNLFLAKQISEI